MLPAELARAAELRRISAESVAKQQKATSMSDEVHLEPPLNLRRDQFRQYFVRAIGTNLGISLVQLTGSVMKPTLDGLFIFPMS